MSSSVKVAYIEALVVKFFKGNWEKARIWLASSNPNLGGIAPNEMIRLGREDKLLTFVQNSLTENK